MTDPAPRSQLPGSLVAILGTGVAFAFLEAGAFRDLGPDTLRRMVAPAGLRAAALGATVTAVLLVPVLVWQRRRARRGAARSGADAGGMRGRLLRFVGLGLGGLLGLIIAATIVVAVERSHPAAALRSHAAAPGHGTS